MPFLVHQPKTCTVEHRLRAVYWQQARLPIDLLTDELLNWLSIDAGLTVQNNCARVQKKISACESA
ncbi:MAG TPA: hypothetical protein VIZ65_00965 [Cellvibrionaceae bacterium]